MEEVLMNKKISTAIWVAAVCLVIVAAYLFYNKNKPQNITFPPQQQTTSTVSSQSNSNTVPDFSLKDLDGKTVKLSNYRGKIVILNFWAVWCKYCKLEMPDLNGLNTELVKNGEAVILAVDVQESVSTVENYLKSNNITLKVLLDQDGSIAQTYGITGLPTTFVINRDGSLYRTIPGATDKSTLKGILSEMKSQGL
jgi:peroxiredoxin